MEKENTYCRCLYYSANALARIMTKMGEEAFAVIGLPPSYALMLMSINKNPGIQAGELAEVMMLSPSTITRLTEKLEKKGFVKRVSEGRTTLIFPLKKSMELDELIREAWAGLFQKYSDILGDEQAKALTTQIFEATQKLGV